MHEEMQDLTDFFKLACIHVSLPLPLLYGVNLVEYD